MEMSILIFNNYTGFKEIMEPLLEGEGIKIISVSDYDELEIRIRNGNVQLLLLDLELSSAGWCSGIEMISEIRGLSSLPMIIISGQTAETAKIMALDSGADDYVTQEVNPLVLLARIKSQIRRYTKLINVSENIGSIYRVDGLEINDDTREVSVEGRHGRRGFKRA
ncbi:MAG: response regulator [Lachnospiraceae bacterium]|nr:response regulator [Lachnospiraceae bacterium]